MRRTPREVSLSRAVLSLDSAAVNLERTKRETRDPEAIRLMDQQIELIRALAAKIREGKE